jgi:hypothetical protein
MPNQSPGLICFRCSKPVRPGTGQPLAGGDRVHARCLVPQMTVLVLASRAIAQADTVRAPDLIARGPRVCHLAGCPVCGAPLSRGRSLMFQGEQLVHAGCWQQGTSPAAPRSRRRRRHRPPAIKGIDTSIQGVCNPRVWCAGGPHWCPATVIAGPVLAQIYPP